MLVVTTSDLEALPHQIRAVYGELLPRTPLRYLLADDPGAGKTIMAGLYVKELMCSDADGVSTGSGSGRSAVDLEAEGGGGLGQAFVEGGQSRSGGFGGNEDAAVG